VQQRDHRGFVAYFSKGRMTLTSQTWIVEDGFRAEFRD
jgi:hypothetical protein